MEKKFPKHSSITASLKIQCPRDCNSMLLLLTFLNCSGNFFYFFSWFPRLFFSFLCLFKETENTLLTVIHTFNLSLRFHFKFCELFFFVCKRWIVYTVLRIFFNVHQRCFSSSASLAMIVMYTRQKVINLNRKVVVIVYNQAVKNGLLFFVCLKVAICDCSVFYVTRVY